jgi:hypothetical protein
MTNKSNHQNKEAEPTPNDNNTLEALSNQIQTNQNQDLVETNNQQQTPKEISKTVKEFMTTITKENYDECIERVRSLKQDNKIESCFDLLEAMIHKGLEMFKDSYHIKLAIPYFKLGDLILMKIENDNDLFGGGAMNNEQKPDATPMSEREQEIETAFENLELSRVLISKFVQKEDTDLEQKKKYQLILADVFKRLSECEILKENFSLALAELDKGIEILELIEDLKTSRMLSEFYFLKSCIHSYCGDQENLLHSKSFAIKAKAIIDHHLTTAKDSQNQTDLEGLQLITKTMNDKILDLEEELKELPKQNQSQIKENIKKSTKATTTSFPKSQFENTPNLKINLGTFGKGKQSKNTETSSKQLNEPLSNQLKANPLEDDEEEHKKPLQKMMRDSPHKE